MKLFTIALLVAILAVAELKKTQEEYDINDAQKLFDQFVKDYNKSYRDQEDKNVHYDAFVNNLKKINELNNKNNGTYGITESADKTMDEQTDGSGYEFLKTDAESEDSDRDNEYNIDDASNLFDKFIRDYNKSYKDEEEKDDHYDAFVDNLRKINELNRENNNKTYGITESADKTKDERGGESGYGFLKLDD